MINLEDVFPNGKVTRVVLDDGVDIMAVELEVGSGEEIWKIEGVFNE